ncbi:MAG: Trigger factor [Syntrophus sp. PtaB.Bin001]|nr:MAG: Trigger factor [Syntrophus sp. PtaB.Bin001]
MEEIDITVKVEEISPVKKKISIDVPWSDVQKERDKVYRNIGKTAKIKGFRQGKVPRKILQLHYEKYADDEVISNLINKYYVSSLERNNIKAINQPQIDQNGIEEGKSFSFSATFEVEPQIDPVGYTGMTLEKEDLVVTEKEVEDRLEEIRKMFGTLEEVVEDRAIREGDFVTIDFEGVVEGEKLEDMKRNDYFLEIGSKTMIPGFEDQIVGEKIGHTKEFTIKFPDEYQIKAVAGKDATFTVKIKTLKEKILPQLDENFVKNFERYESLDALKADIRKSIVDEKQRKIDTALSTQIIDELIKENDFEVPSYFVEQQIFFMITEAQKRLMSTGMDPQMISQVSETWHDRYKDEAIRIVKSSILLKNIAHKENIDVTAEELEERLKEIAQQYSQDYEKVSGSFDEDMKENIKSDLLNKKVFEFIQSKATIKIIEKEANAV